MRYSSTFLRKHSRLFAGFTVCTLSSPVFAATLGWDPSHLGTSGSGGIGTWDLSSSAWSNLSVDQAWTDTTGVSDIASFGGVFGTVSLVSGLGAKGLVFTTGGYTLSGGALTLGASGINAGALSGGTTTISSNLTLWGGQQWTTGAGSTLAFSGTITRNTGAAVNFSSTGTITTTSPSVANTNGILGGWATLGGTNWATIDGGNNIVAYSAYTAVNTTKAAGNYSTENWRLTGAAAASAGATTINSFNNPSGGDFFVPNGATVTVASGGFMVSGNSRWITNTGNSLAGTGAITSGLAGGELFINSASDLTSLTNRWRIWPKIVDNGSTAVNVVKTGSGGIALSANNTFTGQVIVNQGVLALGGTNSYAGGTVVNNGGYLLPGVTILDGGANATPSASLGSGSVTINTGGVMEISYHAVAASTISNAVVLNGGALWAQDGVQTLSGNLTVNSGGGFLGMVYRDPGASTKGLYVTGLISGSGPLTLEQAGAGGNGANPVLATSWSGYTNQTGNTYNASNVVISNNANTYSGTATVQPYTAGGGSWLTLGGTTAMQNATVNLAGNNNAVTGQFGASTLLFQSGLGGGFTIGALSGSGNVSLSAMNVSAGGTTGIETVSLTVGGNNASTTYSGVISDGAIAGGSLRKIGSGTFTLSGANTYTGATTVTAGVLALGASNVFANSSNFILGGGTLSAGIFSDTVGTLSLTGNSTISFGSGGSFAFADSHLLDWGTHTLTISGSFLSGQSLRFGTGVGGLSGAQLALIDLGSGLVAGLDADGFLVASAVPEPSTFAVGAGMAGLGFAGLRRRRRA